MKSKFSHVMNDDLCGLTFIYFNPTHIQNLDDSALSDLDLGETCIHLDEQNHHKLLNSLQKEPVGHLTVFNEKEIDILKACFDFMDKQLYTTEDYQVKPDTFTDEEWKEFLNKLS
jgi:hypothetical protein